uniref:NHS-like 2 n=1 Tax=Oryzias melastigma TaxID=30732 RepID=A0A3B3CKI1_ORYME
MDHSGLLYSSSSSTPWNGPKGSTFSPAAWNESYNHTVSKGPAVPPKQHSIIRSAGGAQDGVMLVSSGHSGSSHSSSFTSVTAASSSTWNSQQGGSGAMGRRSETEGAAAEGGKADGGREPGRGRERSARSIAAQNAFKFRERSLSTPTDSGSFSTESQHHNFLGESYAFLYPKGSSEDSTSTADTISVSASEYSTDGRLRFPSRSISLKKSKRKPPPPVRSVSLMKNLGETEGRIRHEGGLNRDGRPKSLHIPRDHFPDFQPDFLLPASKAFANQWQLGEWKSSDPYRSLSGSSTATGTTVMECMKVRGSSESLLDSPSTSRATSPSQLSVETDAKPSSPFKPPGFMSPSSGYSSQSETPTPTVPLRHVAGQGSTGCKMRPKIPERKSSLPSPKDPAARSRLSFEMPGNAHLELSSIKPKQKASRRHSDTSTTPKPGKISPNSSQALPVVTQNELKTIRLRSISRGDLEDCPDGASDTIEEELHGRDFSEDPSPPPTLPKPKPPVAMKPPLPKRPINLPLKSPSPSSTSPHAVDSPPASPVERPVPLDQQPKKVGLVFGYPLIKLDIFFFQVPPPVPKKPNVLLLPTSLHSSTNGNTDRQIHPSSTPADLRSPTAAFAPDDISSQASETLSDQDKNHVGTDEDSSKESSLSKRKVLGRKEPSDSFSSRQNLVSPVKHCSSSSSGADLRNLTLGSSQRSSSRNENFMALLQKKGSKSSSGGARVSAMELLKSTNPLARRITEFSTPSTNEGEDPPLVSDKPIDQ